MWGETLLKRATEKVAGKVAGAQLEKLATELRNRGGLSLRIVLPDGTQADLGDSPRLIWIQWLRPTARNKMWNAVIDSKATADGFQDLYGIPEQGDPVHQKNLRVFAVPLLSRATSSVTLPYSVPRASGDQSGRFAARVGNMPAHEFLSIFDQLTWHDSDDKIVPLRRFIATAADAGRLNDWMVLWPQRSGSATVAIDGLGMAPVLERNRRDNGRGFVGSSPHHRAPGLLVARGQEVPEVRADCRVSGPQ